MKISINDQEYLTFSETEKMIIENEIDSMQEWVEKFLYENTQNKISNCFDKLKKEWEPKLAERGIEMAPTDKAEFAELVFSQPDYKNRTERDAEALQLKQQEAEPPQ